MRKRSRAETIAMMSPEQRALFWARFGTKDRREQLKFSWEFWGRPSQFAPEGDWLNWLILAGRGFGKTRTGAEWVRANMCGPTPLTAGRWRHIALIAETAADARDVMVGDGKATSDPKAGSGLLQISSSGVPADLRALQAAIDLAERCRRLDLQWHRAGSAARPPARCCLV